MELGLNGPTTRLSKYDFGEVGAGNCMNNKL